MAGPRILIVGAGAVGQTYAYYLARGGATISFYVKPKHAAACEAGFDLHELRVLGRPRPRRLVGAATLTTIEEVAACTWDQVWLCLSTTGLRGGKARPEEPSWLDALLPAIGDALVVSLQPDLDDRAFLTCRLPETRLVSGLITFVAYAAPLPGERLTPPGVAFMQPPLAPNPFSGPRADEVVTALRRGGASARRVRDVSGRVRLGAAILIPTMAVLGTLGWSLRAVARGPGRARVRAIVRESAAIVARGRPGLITRLLLSLYASALGLTLVARLLPRLTPFDLEVYLRAHFTKVGDQTRVMLATYCEHARALGLPHETLAAALAQLDPGAAPPT